MSQALPRIYTDLAGWYPLLTAPAEYGEEAAFYWDCFARTATGPLITLLELGSGSGAMASHYKQQVTPTLTDISVDMLALSRTVNPDLEHIQGDMRTLRLGRHFDAVFAHDAVMYLLTEDALREAIVTAHVHLAPDCVLETFRPQTDTGGNDGDGRALRYLEWVHDPDPTDTTFVTDYTYVYREGDGVPVCEQDRHTVGLFSREVWLRLLEEVGFQATIRPLVHSEVEPGDVEVFVVVKRPA
jgi:hypothetical protein